MLLLVPNSAGAVILPAPVAVEHERHQADPERACRDDAQREGNPAMSAEVAPLERAHDPDDEHDQDDEADTTGREAEYPAHCDLLVPFVRLPPGEPSKRKCPGLRPERS